MSSFKVVIPARYASLRLPAKPLADIVGQPMVVRVMEQAIRSGAEEVWVATDHPAVVAAVERAGGHALMTRADHASGTDRLGEVVERLGWTNDTLVVNVQGDEPLIDPLLIAQVAQRLAQDTEAAIATACHPITSGEELFNPAAVKVVCNAHGNALYFTRAPIPYARDEFANLSLFGTGSDAQYTAACPAGLPACRHIGLYAYRAHFLKIYAQLDPAPFEQWEKLEQLRALWHGYRISVMTLEQAPAAGVDTPEDLERVRRIFAGFNNN